MNSSTRCLVTTLFFIAAALGSASAQSRKIPHFDIRSDTSESSRAVMDGLRAGMAGRGNSLVSVRGAMAQGKAALAARVPALNIELNPVTQAPEDLDAAMGATTLTPPSTTTPEAVVRGFLTGNAAVFGLTPAQASDLKTVVNTANPAANLSWVEVEQSLNGLPVFQGTLRAAVRKDGSILRATGNLAAGLNAASLPMVPKISAAAAAVAAAATVGVATDAESVAQTAVAEGGRKMTLAAGPFVKETQAELVYFPLEPGVATLAYSMVLWQKNVAWYVLVDAQSGQLLWRKNITNDQSQAVSYSVYDGDSPNPLSPTNATPGSGIQGAPVTRNTLSLISELPAFDNLGWITDDNVGGTANAVTTGNNVDAGLDLDTTDGIDAGGRAVGTGRVFNFSYIPGGQPGGQAPTGTAYRNGVVTNLFFWSNRYHDRLYTYGFTEQFRNFQANNFGRGGSQGDRVLAQAQDSSGTDNANFSTPPDGQSGVMQMYIFSNPNPQRDGDLDQDVVLHELTHGVSNRLHANGSGLTTEQAGGMGEGWSDFYARCLLSTADEDVNGVYAAGAYATRDFFGLGTDNSYYGIRRFPYAVKTAVGANGKPHNPMTFAEIDPGKIFTSDGAFAKSPIFANTAQEVHAIGEIWCLALLEVRARIITRLGWAAGNDRVLQIVTDAMKLDPASPTLIQARNSILAAASGTAADVADVWAGFAAMGMGFNASGVRTNQNPTSVVESFITPNLIIGNATFTDSGAGTSGNGDGFADPGETLVVTVPISNRLGPSTNTVAATATSVKASVAGGAVVPVGTIATGATVNPQFTYTVPVATSAGTRLNVVVDINSSLGQVGPAPLTFPLTVGQGVDGLTENFDLTAGTALPSGWTTTHTGAGVNWVASSANSADGSPKNAYSPNVGTPGSASMVTPAIAITSPAAVLTFRNSYNLEWTPGAAFYDGMVLEISLDGGTTYQDIVTAGGTFLSGGYNATLEYTSNPLAQRNAWSGLSAGTTAAPGYITTQVLLPAAALGKTVRFKWIVGNDDSTTAAGLAGARVDSVVVTTGALIGPSNRPPIINNQSFSVVEHSAGMASGTNFAKVIASDPDAGQTLTYAITGGNTGTAFSINDTTGQLTVLADLEHDTDPQFVLTVQVTDNAASPRSSSAAITVKIRGTTHPVITGQNTVVMLEDTARTIVLGDLVVNDSDSVYPDDFILTVMDGTNYTRSGNTVTAAADFNGVLSVPVIVNDGVFDSDNTFSLQVTVTPVNDAPSFVKGPNVDVIAGQAYSKSWAPVGMIKTGPANESAQASSFSVTTNNDGLFSSLPIVAADGTLSFTAAGVGSASVTVVLHDDGGGVNPNVDVSGPQTFLITSTPATNDPPSFFIGPDQAVAQDAGAQSVGNFLTGISPGPPDEVLAGQTVSFIVSVPLAEQGLFDVPPAISPDGTLTYTPKTTASGTATVTVIGQDNIANMVPGDDNTSDPQTFTISVTTFAGHSGSYNGLALPSLGTLRGVEKTGLFALKVMETGAFTGKLRTGPFSFTLKGVVDNAGVLKFGKISDPVLRLERKNLPPLFLELRVDVIGTTGQVNGTIRGETGPPTSDVLLDRAQVYAKNAPPVLTQGPNKGLFTVIFDRPNSLLLLPAAIPQGDGYGSVKISEKGIASIDGYLADGTKLKYANALSKTNTWPLWIPFAKGGGALAGRVQFRLVPNVSDLDGADLLWFRPEDLKSKKILYPGGWKQGITTTLIGSVYLPDKDFVALCIDPGLASGAPHNAKVTLVGGDLGQSRIRAFKINGKKFEHADVFGDTSITFTPATGVFKGTYDTGTNAGGKYTLKGAVLQKQKMGSGFFDGDKSTKTGSVTLEPQP